MKANTPFLLLLCLMIPLGSLAQRPAIVLQTGHSSKVSDLQFSADGTKVVTGSDDHTAIIWSVEGQQLAKLIGHTDRIYSVAFSPEGTQILTTSKDKTIRLWDMAGNEIRQLKGHSNFAQYGEFSPDGSKILTWAIDRTVKIWDRNGRELHSFANPSQAVKEAGFSPDSRLIFTARDQGFSKPRLIQCFEMSGKERWRGEGGKVAFTAESKSLLITQKKGIFGSTLKQIVGLSGEGTVLFDTHPSITRVLPSADGKEIVMSIAAPYGQAYGSIRSMNFQGEELWRIDSIPSGTLTIRRHPTGKGFAMNKGKGAVLWDMSGQLIRRYSGIRRSVNVVQFSPNGKQLLTAGADANIHIWDASTGEKRVLKGHQGSVNDACFSPDGRQVFSGGPKTARLWEVSGRLRNSFKNSAGFHTVSFSPDGKKLLGGGLRMANIWYKNRVGSFSAISLDVSNANVYAARFSPDGREIVTVSSKTVKFWDAAGRFKKQSAPFHEQGITSFDFSPNGQYLLTSSFDGTAKVWTRSPRLHANLRKHTSTVTQAVFSPDGKKILTSSIDKTARMWSLNGAELFSLRGHTARINAVAFSPDGKHLLTGSNDGTSKLWDAATGKEIATLFSLPSGEGWVVLTPEGRFDGDANGLHNIHYVADQEVIELDQLKERFYEPDLLAKLLGISAEPLRNITQFSKLDLYPRIQTRLNGAILEISLTPRTGGIGRVSLSIGSKEVEADLNPNRIQRLRVDLNEYASFFIPDSAMSVGIRAWNAEEWLVSKEQSVRFTVQAKVGQLGAATRLFALCIGTSDYAGEQLDLNFAEQDAAKMATVLRDAGQQLLFENESRVQVQVLSTARPHEFWPSKPNIEAAMKTVARKSRPGDLFVLYLSGHGTTASQEDNDYFYYLTHELQTGDISDRQVREQYAISTAEWAKWLTAIPAQKQVLILDACASGTFNESYDNLMASRDIPSSQKRALDRLHNRTGLFVISGSTADQVSYEASPFGQGLLTYSLLRGIQSGEALREEQYVDVLGLFSYAKEIVPELAKQFGGIQKPMILSPYGGESYDIGRATAAVRNRIELSAPKPIFSRVRLNNEETFDDDLDLERIVNGQLRDFSKKGSDARLVFVDVGDDPLAYRIVGSYRVEGERVLLRARVKKGNENVGEAVAVEGEKGDLEALGQQLIRKAYGESRN